MTAAERPSVPGLRFRPCRGANDIPAMGAVYRAANDANGVAGVWADARIRVEIENWTHLDPLDDLILAVVDDRLVAGFRDELG